MSSEITVKWSKVGIRYRLTWERNNWSYCINHNFHCENACNCCGSDNQSTCDLICLTFLFGWRRRRSRTSSKLSQTIPSFSDVRLALEGEGRKDSKKKQSNDQSEFFHQSINYRQISRFAFNKNIDILITQIISFLSQ